MNQETVQIRHQNVKPVVTEIPIDPENCPFATRHPWEDGCFAFCCTLDHNHTCMICNEGKDCNRVVAMGCEQADPICSETDMYTLFHKGLPKESGSYVTVSTSGTIQNLAYSAKYKAFNVCDFYSKNEIDDYKIDNIMVWCKESIFLGAIGLLP